MKVEQWILLFFLYGFLGWLMECIYALFYYKRIVNRGFLTGPICPMYGFGGVMAGLWLMPLQPYGPIWVFIGGFVLFSVLEYVTGALMNRLFHARWWDYSNSRFNLNGYICLSYSILWGFAAIAVVWLLQPFAERLIRRVPEQWALGLSVFLCAVFLGDTIHAIIHAVKLTDIMQKLSALERDWLEATRKLKEGAREWSAGKQSAEARERSEGKWTEAFREWSEGKLAEAFREWREAKPGSPEEGAEAALKEPAEEWREAKLKDLAREWADSKRARLEELRSKFEADKKTLLENLSWENRRQLKAFRGIRSKRYQKGLDAIREYLRSRK